MPAPTSPIATHGSPGDQVTPGRSTAAGCEDHVVVLTDADVAEVLAARDAVRRASLPLLSVGRADFPLPALGPKLAGLVEELDTDDGHVVIRGIPVHRLSEADLRLVFWGLGRHLGIPVSQDALGRLIRPADTTRTDFHSGGSDVTALLIRDEGRTVSLIACGRIVDEVVLRHPYLAVRLFDAWPHDRMGEDLSGEWAYRSTPLASSSAWSAAPPSASQRRESPSRTCGSGGRGSSPRSSARMYIPVPPTSIGTFPRARISPIARSASRTYLPASYGSPGSATSIR